MRLCLVACLFVLSAGVGRADDLYDFVIDCKADTLANCFGRIGATLDRVRAEEQGRAFCLPKVWYPVPGPTSYPVSLLDYLLLRLSAARVGRAGHPYEVVLRDVLAEMYPCRQAKR